MGAESLPIASVTNKAGPVGHEDARCKREKTKLLGDLLLGVSFHFIEGFSTGIPCG